MHDLSGDSAIDREDDHQREFLVEMEGITKAFPGTKALEDISWRLRPGEIHALIGENGAGKSTLIKILGGIYRADQGEIRINGRTVDIKQPKEARQLGIGVVFQEFNLIPDLSVAQNLFLSIEKSWAGLFLKRRDMIRASQRVLDKIGLRIDANRKVSAFSVAEQQLLEIAKALLTDSRILILDEPTAVLATREVENLFRIMREFKDQGRALAFVSHRLDEVLKIADQITVLKDGRNAGALPNKNVDNNDLISLMVGKEFEEIFIKEEKTTKDEVLLKVENLSVGDKVRDVSFSIRSGEIVALGGLEGHGQQIIIEALFGLHRHQGHVSLDERPIRLTGPKEALRKGIMMITDDRKGEGLALDLSVLHNLEVLNYNRFSNRAGVIRPAKEKALAAEVISRLAIKTPYMSQMVKYLSGGNQQKVMIGRISYLPRVRLLLFKELTRGVDVGAKIEIYNLLHDMVKGAAGDSRIGVLFYSSDMLEILGLSDRIIGIYDGRVTAVLNNKDLNEEKLMGEIIKGAGRTEGDDAIAEPAAEVL